MNNLISLIRLFKMDHSESLDELFLRYYREKDTTKCEELYNLVLETFDNFVYNEGYYDEKIMSFMRDCAYRNGERYETPIINTQCVLLNFIRGYIKSQDRIDELEKENEMLKTHIKYMPGGEGYRETEEHFKELVKNE